MGRDTYRSDERPEVKVFFAVCLDSDCGWESESYEERDEVPSECSECGGDCDVESDYV